MMRPSTGQTKRRPARAGGGGGATGGGVETIAFVVLVDWFEVPAIPYAALV